MTKTCGNCKKPYESKNKKYCSLECLFAHLKTNKNDNKGLSSKIEAYDELITDLQPRFEDIETLECQDVTVAGDFHLPYVNQEFLYKMLSMSKTLVPEPRTCVITGDLVDFDTQSVFGTKNKEAHLKKDLDAAKATILLLLSVFDTVWYVMGNHEERIMRRMDHYFTAKMLRDLILDSPKNFKVTPYPYLHIKSGQHTFRVTHPRTYSRLCNATVCLAAKHRCTVLGFHGHLFGIRTDLSSEDFGYDVGCMTDPNHHSYIVHNETTHPKWVNGFTIIKDGSLFPFTNNPKFTNWDWWLNMGNQLPSTKIKGK